MDSNKRGVSIIEIVIAAAIIGISVIGVVNSLNVFLTLSMKNTNEAQAALVLEETLEVLQYIRDKGWESNIKNLNGSIDYHIFWNGIDYSATSTPQVVNDKFTRTFRINEVQRGSGTDDIISSGGYIDLGTKKVSVEIAWKEGIEEKKINSEFLIHNVYQN